MVFHEFSSVTFPLKCTVLSRGIQAQALVLFDIFAALNNSEKKDEKQPVADQFGGRKDFFSDVFFSFWIADGTANSEQSNVF